MLIREFAFSQDFSATIALWEASGPGVHLGHSDTPEEIEKKLRRDPDLFLVAEDDGVLIGTVIGGFDGRRGMIYHLAVEQSYRGQGIGKALMAELESRLKAKGCRRAYLMVVKGNDDAGRFYEKLGWGIMTNVDTFAKDL
jgi:ribosomal protein S18 acetylase RimI-like enzyme